MKKDMFVCVAVAAFSLIVAAVFHRFFPGFGMVFKPLLWPLAVLPFMVRARFALLTALIVPLLSCAINGMPSVPVAISLSAFSAIALCGIAVCRRVVLRRMKTAV